MMTVTVRPSSPEPIVTGSTCNRVPAATRTFPRYSDVNVVEAGRVSVEPTCVPLTRTLNVELPDAAVPADTRTSVTCPPTITGHGDNAAYDDGTVGVSQLKTAHSSVP